jgi:enoyl-[acyl-carrier protein] reductase/trans-2-enoyl-CoA reductase (NAD+)
VQQQVSALWAQVETDNLDELTDFKGYQTEFLQLFGFEVPGIDYEAEVETLVPIEDMA